MKRKWTALVLTLSMVCALVLTAQAAEANYSDTADHYAAGVIGAWSGYGVLKGYEDGTFRPDGTITRAELAAVLNRVMGYQDAAENTFTDLPGELWYTDGLLRLAKQGIFRGGEDGKMNPEAPITRQETFAAMARALALEESEEPTGFQDDATISDWAKGYVSAMKQAGYIEGDQKGNIRANEPITRAEVVTILNKMVSAFVNTDGTYSEDCKGSLFVNAQNVTLKDMTIDGDLVITDGVGNGDVYLDKVEVKGDVILRGCGENSFHILPGTNVKNIIVTKTASGAIRLVNESGKAIPLVYVNDGQAGVVLEGDELGDVVIAGNVPVTIASKKVKNVSVVADAKVTVAKGTTVSKLSVGKTAANAALTVSGRVSRLTNDAKISVDKQGGTVGGGSSSSSSSSGSSSTTPDTSESPAPSETPAPSESPDPDEPDEPTEIAQVKLQLMAPVFAATPANAAVLGTDYTAVTKWFNAGGSAPTYRWRAEGSTEDTFTADQAYQAVITLSPMSGEAFADDLKVSVTDGNGNDYTPAKVEKQGNDRVVTMVYEKTAAAEYLESLHVGGPDAMLTSDTETLKAYYVDNRLVDPTSHTYKWYRCSDAKGSGKTEVAATKEYTIPAAALIEAVDGDGVLYYMVEVTVAGKTYASDVHDIEVQEPLDPDKVPQPKLRDELEWGNIRDYYYDAGATFTVYLDDLVKHKNLRYNIGFTYQGVIEKRDGSTVSIADYEYQSLPHKSISLGDYRSDIVRTENGAYGSRTVGGNIFWLLNQQMKEDEYWQGDIKSITITGIQTEVMPKVYYDYGDSRNQELTDRSVAKLYDLSAHPIVYNLVRADDPQEDPNDPETPYWSEDTLEGAPLPGTYRYTGTWKPEVGYDGKDRIVFYCALQRKDGEEYTGELTRPTQKMQEDNIPMEESYAIYSLLTTSNDGGEMDMWQTETSFRYRMAEYAFGMDAWGSVGHSYLASEENARTLIGAETYLIYCPEQFVFNCYRLDNTGAEYIMAND